MNKFGQQALVVVLGACAALSIGCNKSDDASTSQQAQTTSATSTPAAATTTSAAAAGSAGGDHHDHAIPQAMLDACTGKKSGDACTVTDNGTARDGTCNAPPGGANATQLACMPAGGPGGHGGGPGGDHHPPH